MEEFTEADGVLRVPQKADKDELRPLSLLTDYPKVTSAANICTNF